MGCSYLVGQSRVSESAGEDLAHPAKRVALFVGHNQEFESAAQSFAVARNRSYLHEIRRHGDGELHGNNFADLNFAAQSGPDAILSQLTGAAPERGRDSFTKYRQLNSCVQTMTRKTPAPVVSGRRPETFVAQSSPSITAPKGKDKSNFQFPCRGYPDSKGSLPPILTTFTAPVME
jgi:hypothetical protein